MKVKKLLQLFTDTSLRCEEMCRIINDTFHLKKKRPSVIGRRDPTPPKGCWETQEVGLQKWREEASQPRDHWLVEGARPQIPAREKPVSQIIFFYLILIIRQLELICTSTFSCFCSSFCCSASCCLAACLRLISSSEAGVKRLNTSAPTGGSREAILALRRTSQASRLPSNRFLCRVEGSRTGNKTSSVYGSVVRTRK